MVITAAITGLGLLLAVFHVAIPQLRIDALLRADKGYGTGTDVNVLLLYNLNACVLQCHDILVHACSLVQYNTAGKYDC